MPMVNGCVVVVVVVVAAAAAAAPAAAFICIVSLCVVQCFAKRLSS